VAAHDAAADASAINKAIKGAGTDEATLIQILGHRSKSEVAAIAHEYKAHYGKSLHDDIQSDVSMNFGELLTLLTLPKVDIRKWLLTKATKGAGTAEKYLVDVLGPATNEEVLEVYQNDPQTIVNILNDVSHGDFSKILKEVLKGQRVSHIDDHEAAQYAEKLYKAGEGKLGTDEAVFTEIFSKLGPGALQQVDHHYQQKHKHTLHVAVDKETSGYYRQLLFALLDDSLTYYADRAYESMHGIGTDERALNFIFALLSKDELKKIGAIIQHKHKKNLEDLVKGDTSGNHEKLLVELLH